MGPTVGRMTVGIETRILPAVTVADERLTRALLGVSAAALAVQVALTDYGSDSAEGAVFWFVVGCLLLRLVHRKRSRVARGVVVVSSSVGALGYGLGALGGDVHAALLSLSFLAQAAPLMTKTIRSHVTSKSLISRRAAEV